MSANPATVGELLLPLHERQKQIIDAIAHRRNVYIIGGKGAGKTTATAYAGLSLGARV